MNVPYLGPEINGTQEVSNLLGKMHDPEVCYHEHVIYFWCDNSLFALGGN